MCNENDLNLFIKTDNDLIQPRCYTYIQFIIISKASSSLSVVAAIQLLLMVLVPESFATIICKPQVKVAEHRLPCYCSYFRFLGSTRGYDFNNFIHIIGAKTEPFKIIFISDLIWPWTVWRYTIRHQMRRYFGEPFDFNVLIYALAQKNGLNYKITMNDLRLL